MASPLDNELFGAQCDAVIDRYAAQLQECAGNNRTSLVVRRRVTMIFADAFRAILFQPVTNAVERVALIRRIAHVYTNAHGIGLLSESPDIETVMDFGRVMMLTVGDIANSHWAPLQSMAQTIIAGIFYTGTDELSNRFSAMWCDPSSIIYTSGSTCNLIQIVRWYLAPEYLGNVPAEAYETKALAAVHRMNYDFAAVCTILFNDRLPQTRDEMCLYCWVKFASGRDTTVLAELARGLGRETLIGSAREAIMARGTGPRTYDLFRCVARACGVFRLEGALRLFYPDTPFVPFLRTVLEATDVAVLHHDQTLLMDLAGLVKRGVLTANDIIYNGGHALHLLASVCMPTALGSGMVRAAIDVLMGARE